MKAFQEQLTDVKGYLKLYEAFRAGVDLSREAGGGSFKTHVKGKLLHEEDNIIVTLGRVRVAELLTGVSTDFVDQVAIGDGGAPQSDLLIPIVPVLADTALVHELDRTTIVNANVAAQTLTFTATFLTASLTPIDFIDIANQVINEAGLFCKDNVLFARKTFPSIPFSPADRVGVIAEWSIEVL